MKGENLPLVDPTPDQQYLNRKRRMTGCPLPQTTATPVSFKKPESGWTKELKGLPDFSDINIRAYATQSGKKVNRTQSNMKGNVTEKTCEKPENRGYQFFKERYLHDMWVCTKDECVYVKAKCYRSQKTKQQPHDLWCVITSNEPSETKHAYCKCVAGASGFCNHVFGLLYQISHLSKSGAKDIPAVISKTSVPQAWDKPRVLGISPEPIMKVVHQKATSQSKKRKVVQSTLYEARSQATIPNDSKRLRILQEKVRNINPLIGISYMATADDQTTEYTKTSMGNYVPVGSVLSYQLAVSEADFDVSYRKETIEKFPCVHNCKDLVFPDLPIGNGTANIDSSNMSLEQKSIIEDILLSKEQCIELEKNTRDQSSSSLWQDARKKRVTASQFGDVVKQRSKETKLADRLTAPKNEKKRTVAMKHGNDYEDVAAKKYEEHMSNIGHPVQVLKSGLVVNPTLPFLGASPDRKVLDKQSHPHFGLLEVKCSYKHRSITAFDAALADKELCCEIKEEKMYLKRNHKFHYQIQGQMAITGTKWCDFVLYTFKGMHIERIYFDDYVWGNALVKLEQFYFTQFVPHCIKLQEEGEVQPV